MVGDVRDLFVRYRFTKKNPIKSKREASSYDILYYENVSRYINPWREKDT